MNYAYLFAGLAGGSILPWVTMFLILRAKDKATKTSEEAHDIPNRLLSERNQIGEREARALTGINASLSLISQHEPADRRERIAAMALQGYLAGRTHDSTPHQALAGSHHEAIAKSCLQYADALICQLSEGETHLTGALNALDVIRTVATEPHHPNALNAIREIANREIGIATGKEKA